MGISHFLFRSCDGKFWEEDLSDAGNAFAAWYYSGEGGRGYGKFIDDYESALASDLPTVYDVSDTWANYDALAPIINQRFAEWKSRTGGTSR